MSQVSTYLRERFPLAAVGTLAVGTAIMLVAAAKGGGPTTVSFELTALFAVSFTAFLLRQRVMDEFKDRGHDNSNYPNRPVQRGAIKIPTLIGLGVFAFAIEISAVVTIAILSSSPTSVLCYLLVLGFSALTAFEFFAPVWLNRHFNIYFASHQMIFAFFVVWAVSVFRESAPATHALATGSAFVLAMAAMEVMRKFEIRKNIAGEIVADTYLAVWGRVGSVAFLAVAFLAAGGLFAFAKGPSTLIAGAVASLGVVLVRNNNKAVQGATILGFFLIALVAFFA